MSKLLSMLMAGSGGGSQIEYLQSDGAIYIPLCESGETLNVKSFKLDIEYLEMDSNGLIYFGRYYSSYGSYASYGLISYPHFIGPGQQDGWLIMFYDRNTAGSAAAPYLNNRRTEEKSFSSQVVVNSNWGLFGGYNQGSGTPNTLTFSKCKIWSCILYDENGNEVANLLPKEENGVLGMYDSARNKFIAGVGSGSFIAG